MFLLKVCPHICEVDVFWREISQLLKIPHPSSPFLRSHLSSLPMGILSRDYSTWKNIKLLGGLEYSKEIMFLHCLQQFHRFQHVNLPTSSVSIWPLCGHIHWAMVLIGIAKPAMSMVVFSTFVAYHRNIGSGIAHWENWGLSIKHIGSLLHL